MKHTATPIVDSGLRPTRSDNVSTLARSTPRQRADLVKLAADLATVLDSLPSRFWATRNQMESYQTVMKHLNAWIAWEEDEND